MLEEKKTILIVDDEKDLCEILAAFFERKGFFALTAGNGIEALKIVKVNKIDIIVSDIRMPKGNGVELLVEVRKLNSSLPVILFITGFTDITVEDAFDKGAEAVFAKPFQFKDLFKAASKAISENEQTQHPRRPLREGIDLKVEVKFPQFEISRQVSMTNLGRGGFFVSLTESLPRVDDVVSFKINIDGELDTVITGEGVVRWVRPQGEEGFSPGCGIEFVSFSENGKSKIYEFINFIKTKQYIPKT
jgi:CheY-like chemotaxis protein